MRKQTRWMRLPTGEKVLRTDVEQAPTPPSQPPIIPDEEASEIDDEPEAKFEEAE